jgi:NAD(P)-dependent dehydrogenase (short-subunit alcohol dehydrogenase family)
MAEQDRLEFLGSVFDLRGRSALVTGAGSGLGAAMAAALARAGAGVVLADVDEAAAKAECAALRAEGLTVEPAALDVGAREQIEAGLDLAERAHGAVDIVFANAGISGGRGPRYGGRIEDVPHETWQNALRVNLDGVFSRCRRPRGGCAAAAAASSSPPRSPACAATRWSGIPTSRPRRRWSTSSARPPSTWPTTTSWSTRSSRARSGTNIGAPADSPEKAALNKDFATTVPLGRVAHTDEMRGLALFLASPASSFVTGTAFAIDGGSLAGQFTA